MTLSENLKTDTTMKTKETIEKLKQWKSWLEKPAGCRTMDSDHAILSDAISLLESMGKDGEMLDWLESKSSTSSYFSLHTQTIHARGSVREAITTAMKKEA